MSKQIFIVCGYSDANGHDNPDFQLSLSNGEHVFCFDGLQFHQNPDEPVFGGDAKGNGSSPIRYMANDLAGYSGDDIAFMAAVNHGPTKGWHDGVLGWPSAAIKETLAMLAPATEQGWELAGVILATGQGDADTHSDLMHYNARLDNLVDRWRNAVGDDTLPIHIMQTELLSCHHLPPQHAASVRALRMKQANAADHIDHATVTLASPHWDPLTHRENFHVSAWGAADWGHELALSIYHYEQSDLLMAV